MQTDYTPAAPKNNTLATVSLILGFAGIPFLCASFFFGICACISGLTGIGATVTGFIARQQIDRDGGTGADTALIGIILGAGQAIMVVCGVIFVLVLFLMNLSFGENSLNTIPGLK